MDFARPLNYAELSDDQLQSAIRFAQERIRWVEQDHVVLINSYRDEVTVMRRHLINRVLARMTACDDPLSRSQYADLCKAFVVRDMTADAVSALVRAATKGRSERLDCLTEVEAMAILLRLERHL